MSHFKTINPANEDILAKYQYYSTDHIRSAINDCDLAWQDWKSQSFSARASLLMNLSNLLLTKKEELAEEITNEMGKPLSQAIAEIEKCSWVCEFYATNGEAFLQPEMVESDASKSYVTFEPLGVVFAVMPWNFPYWQVIRFAAPALMAGNAALLKHSPNTSGCALTIEKLFLEAGFPKGLFKTVLVDIPQIEEIVSNPRIAAVTLTGSTKAGKSLAALSGRYLKKIVLELGGSDPYIILEDADLELAAEACVTGRLINSGQSCIAAKRFIVAKPIANDFTDLIYQKLKEKKVGDPYAEETDIGPLAREDLRDQLHNQVKASIQSGAKCLLGGDKFASKGFYYPPTLLTNVSKGMTAYSEELFGPVASIIVVKDNEEAIQVANDSIYGLGSAIFSRDIATAELIASKINAGSTFINSFVKSDPRLPFGGVKQSGYGRELSYIGIKEFVNIKTVYLK